MAQELKTLCRIFFYRILLAGLVALLAIFKSAFSGSCLPCPSEHIIDLVVGYIIIAVEIATAVILIGCCAPPSVSSAFNFRAEHQTTSLSYS